MTSDQNPHFAIVDPAGRILLGWDAQGNVVLAEAMLERMCRAHDAEECAQKGEPDPWADWLVRDYIAENGEAAWQEWRSERFAAMRAALKALKLK